ncbi:uncharacterized protein LOC133198083 [Saccostrea echinata]|uniref:uncharacterized protein LOC133198083 n=1 Tax=Saccostrea echinata TaxID=191078 RepID=UPI002A7F7966|nr:uncharacterized protein LOC133198083 [Saccostrea echinata]
MQDDIRSSTASSYLELISHDNPPSDLAEITVAVIENATNSSALHNHDAPGVYSQRPLTNNSEIDSYDSFKYEKRHDYTVLRGNERYDDLLNGNGTGTVKYERLTDRVYSLPYQQINMVSNNNENQSKKEASLAVMLCCSITSLVVNCPIGVFSVCYAYMAKTEHFYPMRRYYKCMSLVVSALAIFGFIITITITTVILANLSNRNT